MRRRLLVLLAVLTALLVAGGPGSGVVPRAERVDWSALGYVHYDSGGFYLYVPTNGELWKQRRITNTPSGMSPQPQTPEQFQGKVLEAIWKKTCPVIKAQTVRMSRRIQLPGPVASLRAGLKSTVFNTTMHQGKNPFAWAELRLGDDLLVRLDAKRTGLDTWVSEDVAAGAVEIEDGATKLTVVARKKKTKESWGFCPGGVADFGIAAELHAVPASEVGATIPTGQFNGLLEATITNAGPSTMTGAQFWWRSSQPTGSASIVDVQGFTDAGSCQDSQSGPEFLVTCTLPELAAGTSMVVKVGVQLQNTSCPGDWRVPWAFGISSLWRDPDLSDNQSGNRAFGCSPQRSAQP